jgi:hypothetical protein
MKRSKPRRSGSLDAALSRAQDALGMHAMDSGVPEFDAQARATFDSIESLRRLLLKNRIRDRLNRDWSP